MSNEKGQEIKEKTTDDIPLGVKISSARADMTLAILEVQNTYGLPAYLTDLIVSACLSDIRDCANKELINR